MNFVTPYVTDVLELDNLMSILPKNESVTAEELLHLPDDGHRYELFRGELRQMPPAGEEHGSFAMDLGWRLARFVSENRLGKVYAAETGFKLTENPDTVRAPDAAFISQTSLDKQAPVKGYRKSAPDLAVEVVSPNDRPTEVAEKVYEWLFFGAKEVWILEPEQRTLTVYQPDEMFRVLKEEDTLTSPLFPGWELPLSEIFS